MDRGQIWFDKPISSIIFDKQPLKLLDTFNYVVHEVELGVLLGMQGKNIQAKDARKHIAGYFLAIDFTNRGLGSQFKKDGAPWCL
jgi:acylpyruvate hydrolase